MSRIYPAPLNDLHALMAVARCRSFRQAATQLDVTPSAISHAIKGLEARLGIRLLHRTTRSVAPTQAGERLLTMLAPAMQQIRTALEGVNDWRDSPQGMVRISTPHAAAEYALLPFVLELLCRHASVQVEVVCDKALVDVVAQGFDAGVRFGESLAHDMVALPIGPAQPFVVVASPAYLAAFGRPQTPYDLSQHACVNQRFPSGKLYRWQFERGSESLQVAVTGPLIVNHIPLAVQAAEGGLALAYVYQTDVQTALDEGRLVTVLDDWLPPPQQLYLYYPSRSHPSAAFRALIEAVKAQETG